MCGIAGIVYFDKEKSIDPIVLKNMADIINHRGPDDEGFFIDQNIGLGFRRLSIIDLTTGHQPMSNLNNNIHIVFNGEIYNFKELRELLQKKGYLFITQSDTEVILHLYEEYGVDCVQRLRGMFSFAIWDKAKMQLFCARDRFGIKPFYYSLDSFGFLFSSEIKGILKSGEVDKTISSEALDSYFAFGYITSDLSIYKKIKKLQSGHFLLLSLRNRPTIEISKYWSIHFDPDYSKSEKQWIEEIQSCISETVKLHMVSDVPLGAFLSGGIDSSSIVAMMALNSTLPIKTFSIGFENKSFNELKFAREVAEKYGCDHHEQILEPESISLLPKLAQVYDEPFADSSAIPTYYVSKMAREKVAVVLSGDGGDELFAGYEIYQYLKRLYSCPLNFKDPNLNKLIWGNINNLIPSGFKGKGITHFLSNNKQYIGAHLTFWTNKERSQLILSNDKQGSNTSETYKERLIEESAIEDIISSLQYLDLRTYLVDDILTKVDRSSMLNSLEARVPLLDHKFAELTFQIPSQLKFNGTNQKFILKKAMSPYLPESIMNRPKQGFSVPLTSWFKDDLNEYIKDTLISSNNLYSEYLNKNFVNKSVSNSFHSMRNLSNRTWSLLFFEEWLKINKSL